MSNNNPEVQSHPVEKLYLSGQIDQAIEMTLEKKSEMDLGHFHYNLGSLYLKKGDFGAARVNLEKAIKEGFTLPMAYTNLGYIKKQQAIADSSKSQSFLGRSADCLTSQSPYTFFLSGLIVLSLLLLYLRFSKKVSRAVVVTCFILSLAPIGIYWGWVQNLKTAIVIKDTTVYQGPSKMYEENGILSSGSKIILSKKNNNWYFVEYPESYSGWVERSLLGFY